MKTTSLLAAGLVATGAAATNKLTPDAVEKDIHTDKSDTPLPPIGLSRTFY